MIYYLLFTVLILCLTIGLGIVLVNKHIKQYCDNKCTQLTTDLRQHVADNVVDLYDKLSYMIRWSAGVDVALFNLINVPYLTDLLDPGYPDTYTATIHYKIPDTYVGSTIVINGRSYKITEIVDDKITLNKI